jgi:hypothetical protein
MIQSTIDSGQLTTDQAEGGAERGESRGSGPHNPDLILRPDGFDGSSIPVVPPSTALSSHPASICESDTAPTAPAPAMIRPDFPVPPAEDCPCCGGPVAVDPGQVRRSSRWGAHFVFVEVVCPNCGSAQAKLFRHIGGEWVRHSKEDALVEKQRLDRLALEDEGSQLEGDRRE